MASTTPNPAPAAGTSNGRACGSCRGGTAHQSSGSPSHHQSPVPSPSPQPLVPSPSSDLPNGYPRLGQGRYPPPLNSPVDLAEPELILEPNPNEAASLYESLTDPYQSLADVARNHNVTLTALTAWMARPEVEAELDALERQGARKARLVAVNELPKTVLSLSLLLDSYSYQERKIPVAPNTEAKEQRRRHGESARKAAWLIYRIARFHAGPVPPSPRSPGRGGRVFEAGEGRSPNLIAAPTPSTALSLPPLETVTDALQSLLARAAADRATAPNVVVADDAARPAEPSDIPSPTPGQPARHSGTPRAQSLRCHSVTSSHAAPTANGESG